VSERGQTRGEKTDKEGNDGEGEEARGKVRELSCEGKRQKICMAGYEDTIGDIARGSQTREEDWAGSDTNTRRRLTMNSSRVLELAILVKSQASKTHNVLKRLNGGSHVSN